MNIHLKHSVQNHSDSYSFETHAWHCVERGATWLGGGQFLLDTYREAYREAHYDKWVTKGTLREARQCSKSPLSEDGSHERPVWGMVRSHSQWWAPICRRMCSRTPTLLLNLSEATCLLTLKQCLHASS